MLLPKLLETESGSVVGARVGNGLTTNGHKENLGEDRVFKNWIVVMIAQLEIYLKVIELYTCTGWLLWYFKLTKAIKELCFT